MRITKKILKSKLDTLNELLGVPKTAYSKDKNGKLSANIGTHYLSSGYGGVTVNRIINEGGGVTCPLGHGYVSNRELADKISAYIDGISLGKNL